MVKRYLVCVALLGVWTLSGWGGTTFVDEFNLSADQTIEVAAGDTYHIEYLSGTKTLTKLGEGRLEIAVMSSTNALVVVSNGTFAVVRPEVSPCSQEDSIFLHVDATKAASYTTETLNGTNYVNEWRDADGRNLVKCVPYTAKKRPRPFVDPVGVNGLPLIDFGTLHNAGGSGYGASLLWEFPNEAHTNICTAFVAWMDDPGAKDHKANYRGPCTIGVQSAAGLSRGCCGGGLDAELLVPGSSLWGRLQYNAVLDGVSLGANWGIRVPAGMHVWEQHTSGDTNPGYGWGFGFNISSGSYGGFKLAECIFAEKNLTAAQRTRISAYLMCKWMGPRLGRVILADGATFDTSACRLRLGHFDAFGASVNVTDWGNLELEFYDHGASGKPATGVLELPARGTEPVPNAVFADEATISVAGDTTGAVARVEGEGLLRKTGNGVAVVGTLGDGLESVSVEQGTLRLAPLESPGVWLRLDASATSTLETTQENDVTYVTRWNDANGRGFGAKAYTGNYAFDGSRPVPKAFVTENGLNGKPVVDFGSYTSVDFPDGAGSMMQFEQTLTDVSIPNPGLRNVLVVWTDYAEVKDFVQKDGLPVVGPNLFYYSHYWWRGFGGYGKSFGLHYPNAPTRMNALKIDGVSRNFQSYLPEPGWHLLDYGLTWQGGAPIQYLGGGSVRYTNSVNYVNHTDVPGYAPSTASGVYGGLKFGEIMFFYHELSAKDRATMAATLGSKWFNRENPYSFEKVTLRSGTAFEVPYAQVSVGELTLSGAGRMDGALVLPQDAIVSVGGNVADGLGSLAVPSVDVQGSCTLKFDLPDAMALIGQSILLFAAETVSGDFSKRNWKVSGLDSNVRCALAVRDGGVWMDFTPRPGLIITVR